MSKPSHLGYEKVAADGDSEFQLRAESRHRTSSTWRAIAIGFMIATIVALVVPYAKSAQCPVVQRKVFAKIPCGKTIDSAIAAGCVFDPMMNAWVEEDCVDKELTDEFLRYTDWQFYEDENATRPLTMDGFSRAGMSWGTWEYHFVHCSFAVRKLQRAITLNRPIQMEVITEEHTRHCLMVANITTTLMEKAYDSGERFSMQDMGTVLHTGVQMCLPMHNYLPYEGVVLP